MENAAEALKMAFAVLVFVIAMSLGFMMISQARATADVVYMATDKQDYVVGATAMRNTGNEYRIVGLDTVIPTIYRYAQENYAVTIIYNHAIIARFDLQTENIISSDFPDGEKYQQLINGASDGSVIKLAKRIEDATNESVTVNDVLFKNLYPIVGSSKPFAPWTASPYKIMQRLKVDINGGSIYFNTNTDGTATNLYKGNNILQGGLITYCQDKNITQFEEHYYTVKEVNHLTNEKETKKLEIIYVAK